MTLQEAKEQYAHKYGFNNWENLVKRSDSEVVIDVTERAAEFYAQSCAQSAREQAIDECIKVIKEYSIYLFDADLIREDLINDLNSLK